MCGIAGIAGSGTGRLAAVVERAIESLHHRGPDGRGLHAFPDCVLGHARLSIVDLERGHQPMLDPERLTAVTFNGAIYGYHNLRRSLEDDYSFATASDTEVLLALYRRHGTAMLDRLPGMFAFAIWDQKERSLFAARDRFGEKPLYFARGPAGELIFASEIRAILATGMVEPELDTFSLAHYLHRKYVPTTRTIWRNVGVLPPAHCLTFRDGRLDLRRYWDLPVTDEAIDPQDAIEELRLRLERAVEIQAIADVPVSYFLSGGLDSSTVVAIASRTGRRVRTITLDSDGSADRKHAREIADLYGTDHLEISDRDLDLGQAFLRMAEIFDEPLSDKGNVSTWAVCRAARSHAKVILSGEGGDELLGGYRHMYRPLRGMQQWKARGAAVTLIASLAERIADRLQLPDTLPLRRDLTGATLARFRPSLAEVHRLQLQAFRIRDIEAFGLPVPPLEAGANTLDGILREDLTQMLPGDWMVRTDRASMASGVELRSPFLDLDFASFCVSLPPRLKVGTTEEKWILRRAFEDSWTESIRRRSKQGFQPSDSWMERRDLAPLVRSVLEDADHPLWERLPFDRVTKAMGENPRRRWVVFTLGLWVQRWMKGTTQLALGPTPPPRTVSASRTG